MKYIGIDGCKGGWFYIWLDNGQSYGFGILETIDALASLLDSTDTALIDMPIGVILHYNILWHGSCCY